VRYAPQHKNITHKRIIGAAAELFRAQGIEGVAVTDLMRHVGLTHGGFYAHFRSKDALAVAACKATSDEAEARLKRLLRQVEPGRKFATVVERYLTTAHRDNPRNGCVIAALASEVAHSRGPVSSAMTAGIRAMIDGVGLAIEEDGLDIDSYSAAATMVGAIVLARAAADRKLSDQVISRTRHSLLASRTAKTATSRRAKVSRQKSSRTAVQKPI
jgi:TetR/AcrR family transcriptional regulator, transcriptional repressor for nem operon